MDGGKEQGELSSGNGRKRERVELSGGKVRGQGQRWSACCDCPETPKDEKRGCREKEKREMDEEDDDEGDDVDIDEDLSRGRS